MDKTLQRSAFARSNIWLESNRNLIFRALCDLVDAPAALVASEQRVAKRCSPLQAIINFLLSFGLLRSTA